MAIRIDETGNVFMENRAGKFVDTGRIDSKVRAEFLCSIIKDQSNAFCKIVDKHFGMFASSVKTESIQKTVKQKAGQNI